MNKPKTDGGFPKDKDESTNEQETSGGGLVSGAIAGGLMGSSGGPAGAVLGAIVGGMLGDAFEQSSLESQQRRRIEQRILEQLISLHSGRTRKMEIQTIINRFPPEDRDTIKKVIDDMATNQEVPVQYSDSNQKTLEVTDSEAVREYIFNSGN